MKVVPSERIHVEEPISLARSGVFTFCVGISPQKQLHLMHNSKPVSGVAPVTAGQGCPSQNGNEVVVTEGQSGQLLSGSGPRNFSKWLRCMCLINRSHAWKRAFH